MPPELFATVATMFQRLVGVNIVPAYFGLNSQSRGQDASTHSDCARDASDQLSRLTHVPAGLWLFLFHAVSLCSLIGGGRWLLDV